ncbi:hypothetical protein GE09DRAFT_1226811 [Coniochaeta sp. 2T2.1]|nr:hypothetical protein GE09DRAFT_1226811 [Coniochaeta sp. 2T2.1]
MDTDVALPRPLQIIKRVDGSQTLRQASHQLTIRTASDSSGYSISTDESSRGSVPDVLGELPLVVPKKRQQFRTINAPVHFPHQYQPVSPLRYPEDPTDETTPKARRSNSYESPAPDRINIPALSTKASLLFLKQKENVPPLDSWNPAPSPGSSRISSSNFDISEPDVKALTAGPCLLAAVEISAQLQNVPVWNQQSNSYDIFNSGCLYNLTPTLLPVPQTTILEILQDSSAPTTLYPSSCLLLLVHIQFIPSSSSHPSSSHHTGPDHSHRRRQNSEDLMQDLEFTLGCGSSSTTPYLTVSVSYGHSCFPDTPTSQTRLETTCAASIECQAADPDSVWSPPRARAGRGKAKKQPLFEIVAAHWGREAVVDVARRMRGCVPEEKGVERGVRIARTMGGRKGRDGGGGGLQPPVVPKRKASLRTSLAMRHAGDEDDRENDRAKKIWGEIRRMSSVGSGKSGEDGARNVSGGSQEVDRRRQEIKDKALRNRRSVGADTLRSLVPNAPPDMNAGTQGMVRNGETETTPKRLADVHTGGMNERGNMGSRGDSINSRARGKENMRWSWTGWWQ